MHTPDRNFEDSGNELACGHRVIPQLLFAWEQPCGITLLSDLHIH